MKLVIDMNLSPRWCAFLEEAGHHAQPGKQGPTEVEVLVLLGCGANDRKTAHHGNSVETGTGEDRSGNEHQQRRDEGGLGCVKGGP